MTSQIRDVSKKVDRADLLSKLEQAAINIENARNSGVVGYLAGWEHLTIRDAVRALASQEA